MDLSITLVVNGPLEEWFDDGTNPEGLGLGDWLELYRSQNGAELPKIDISGAKPSASVGAVKASFRGNHPKKGKRGGYPKKTKHY